MQPPSRYHLPTFSTCSSGRLPLHVNQNNNNNDVQAASGVDLRMTMLPAKLKQAGYSTHMTGYAWATSAPRLCRAARVSKAI